MNDGWIKLHRAIKDKGFYKKPEYVLLWIHMLLTANHKDAVIFLDGHETLIRRGSFVTSRSQMSVDTGIEQSKVERIINFLKTEQQIEQQSFNKYRIISILNYHQYQDNEQQIEQQLNSNRTATEQQLNTNNNDKNIKNEKNIKKPFVYSDEFEVFWKAYPKHSSSKQEAFKQWKQATTKPELPVILSAIENQKRAKNILKDAGQFTPEWPDAERWIKKARWDDEIEQATQERQRVVSI